MKKIIVLFSLSILLMQGCASQIYMAPKELSQVLQSENFSFVAKRANPTNYAVINTINTIPNAPSTRILELDNGYGITFKKSEIAVVLPYFGRAYKAPMNADQASYRFVTKDFSLKKSDEKKDRVIYTIVPNDMSNINKIYLEVYSTGSAMVSIDSNDRQPISYDGYIEKLTETKKKLFCKGIPTLCGNLGKFFTAF